MTPTEFSDGLDAIGLGRYGRRTVAAKLFRTDPRTISRWEEGERDIPGPAINLVKVYLKILADAKERCDENRKNAEELETGKLQIFTGAGLGTDVSMERAREARRSVAQYEKLIADIQSGAIFEGA